MIFYSQQKWFQTQSKVTLLQGDHPFGQIRDHTISHYTHFFNNYSLTINTVTKPPIKAIRVVARSIICNF